MSAWSKIDIRDIVRDHYRTLRNYETDRLSVPDWLISLGVPTAAAAAIVAAAVHLKELGTLLTAISVVAGLLFALLILVLDVAINTAERVESEGGTPRRRRRVEILGELKANVAYAVLVSVVAAVALAAANIAGPPSLPKNAPSNAAAEYPVWYTALVVGLLTHFAIVLLMVLKRMYRLLERELVTIESQPLGRQTPRAS